MNLQESPSEREQDYQQLTLLAEDRALNYAATPKHYDVALEIFNAECAKLNALFRLAKVEEATV